VIPNHKHSTFTRRQLLGAAALAPVIPAAALADETPQLRTLAGPDRVVMKTGKTYLRGWAGYGDPPQINRQPRNRNAPPPPPPPTGPAATSAWSKESGPGEVTFADPKSLVTTAKFSTPGTYVLKLTANNGQASNSSTLTVSVEEPPPAHALEPIYTKANKLDSPFWNPRIKALIVNWIPHCVDQINRTDIKIGPGGIDNFVEAAKKLRGEPHGLHKGYVFSNAWVHQTVESMSIALMVDPQADQEIIKAQEKMRATLEDWIPKILAAQESDGYLQTAFTLSREGPNGTTIDTAGFKHWDRRGDHEGYVGGYFLESAINHYLMTNGKDKRLYNAATKLADCWYNNLGPAPKKAWYDGHQEMEQALGRFGRFVNEVEGPGKGQKYIELAKFLLDSRSRASKDERERSPYDQSHLPVTEQYEAVGHSVRAVYSYSGMADVAIGTHDVDYESAVKSLWANIVHKKYYVTGGVGAVGSFEGFGAEYALPNAAYCETCASCGEIFYQWKMHLLYHDAKYADLYEDSLYNGLLGSLDLDAKHFFYDNPLDATVSRYTWHVCPCCVGNLARTLLMLPTWTYTRSADGLNVNLFVGGTVNVENAAGMNIRMVQATDYPRSGKVAITLHPDVSKNFTVRVRIPNRAVSLLYPPSPEVSGVTSLKVNGSAVKPVIEKGYAVITRNWKAGDKIELDVPMKPQRVHANDNVATLRNKVALRYGPMIYNIEKADQDIAKLLGPDSPLTAEWKPDLLGGVVTIKGQFTDGSPMLAIPNYARKNRSGPPTEYPPQGQRVAADSIIWIKERDA